MAAKVSISTADKNRAKAQVTACVDIWIKLNPSQYELVKQDVINRRNNLRDEKFAEVKEMDSVDYLAYSLPEDLHYGVEAALLGEGTSEEQNRSQWFRSHDGVNWFCKKFPEFAFPKYI